MGYQGQAKPQSDIGATSGKSNCKTRTLISYLKTLYGLYIVLTIVFGWEHRACSYSIIKFAKNLVNDFTKCCDSTLSH